MTAFGTLAEFHARGGGIQRVTPDTVKNGFASFTFEAPMVPAIVVKPQPEKHRTHEDAVNDDGSGEFEHRKYDGGLNLDRQARSAFDVSLPMKSEREKMLSGELYDPMDAELVRHRQSAREICRELNGSEPRDGDRRTRLIAKLIGVEATDVWIEPPFHCDYGRNITLGRKVYFNFNCVILDVMPVRIGSHTLLGPAVQIYTAMHPINADERRKGLEFAKAVTLGDDVWVGGAVVICPGVTVGDRAVIGAGSVVTRDVPADTFAAGNPCRVIRTL